jgi:hypothetical protein
MKTIRRFYLPIFLLYAVCSTALFLVAYLLRSPESATFTRNVIWAEVLLFVLWLPVGAFFRPNRDNADEYNAKQAVLIPSLMLLILGYVVLSGGMFAYSLFVMDLGVTGVAVQVVLGAVTLVAGLGLQFAMAHASEGEEKFTGAQARDGVFSPDALSRRLALFEGMLAENKEAAELSAACRQIREGLTHRLPSAGSITSNPEYQVLSRELDAFLSQPAPADAAQIADGAARARGINNLIGAVVSSLKK